MVNRDEGKVKCTLVQAPRLCTGRTAHSGSDHGTIRGWGVSVTRRPHFIPGKDPLPIVQEAGWAPGPVWAGAENLVPTEIRSPERLARSQSLYRLSYPTHNRDEGTFKSCISELDGKKHAILDPNTTAADEQSSEIIIPSFRFLWPCIVSKVWREKKTNKMQKLDVYY